MQQYLQEISQKHKTGKSIPFSGSDVNGVWQDGILGSSDGSLAFNVTNGIPRFVKPEDETWGTEDMISKNEDLKYWLDKTGINLKDMIEFIYNGKMTDDSLYKYLQPEIEEMLNTDCVILECAAGPAGGYIPFILRSNPKAKVIMNEKSFWLLNEWKKMNSKLRYKNLSFALFDLTDSPFPDNSFDIMSSWFGVSNISESTQQGLNECFRTLKKNGKIYLHEIEISDDTLSALTPDKLNHMKALVERSEKFGIGSYNSIITMINDTTEKQLARAGFRNITSAFVNKNKPDSHDGDIPGIFHEAGIELVYNMKRFTAIK